MAEEVIKEAIKENKEELRATLSMTTKKGYGVLITIPFSSTNKEIDEMLESIDWADIKAHEKGFTAPSRFGGTKPKAEKQWVDKKCPTCNGRLYTITTKAGKKLNKCENSTFINGVAGGCPYIEWLDKDEEKYY